jgi:hypothetical protein
MAKDPWAATKYFHFIINLILEVVLRIKKTCFSIQRKPGVLGTVRAYLGTVEAQGRRTLHLHMLLWLKEALTMSVMENTLKNETFRSKVRLFIQQTVQADIDQKTETEVQAIPKTREISYSRPVDLCKDPSQIGIQQKLLARALQLHTCHTTTCLKNINGQMVCKRGAPFAISDQDWINEDGTWGPKRLCAYLNNWNNCVMSCLRGNHDLKLIMSRRETCVATLYCTNYAYKKQNQSSNASALIIDQLERHQQEKADEEDVLCN